MLPKGAIEKKEGELGRSAKVSFVWKRSPASSESNETLASELALAGFARTAASYILWNARPRELAGERLQHSLA
mgnify:CR=1 FL=1